MLPLQHQVAVGNGVKALDMRGHPVPVGLPDIADGEVVAGVAPEGAVLGGKLLFCLSYFESAGSSWMS